MARQVLDNGIVLPSEYSDDWYDDMTSNLTKLDEVIGSNAEKLSASDVGAAAISNDYDDLDDKPAYNILRRASVTLTAGGTGNYSDLDSDSKIKAGDYVLDAANKLYSITAIDAANSTYTVSAAAIINITDKSELGAAALSNDYDDLDDKPAYNILRRASVTLTAGGTGNYSDLDSDSKIKAGDYVLDAANKLYSITAIDAANSTYTVSAAALFTVTDKAELGAAALSNSYDDLNNLPGYGILRFCSTAITDNSSVPFSSISSVSKIAAGDFLLDTAGKLYQIASVDTVNETAAVTTPVTQLALDANVMHLSGNESVNGEKVFGDVSTFDGSYIGNEVSTNARTVQILESNRDTHGQSGVFLTKFRQNKAQGSMSGNDIAYLSYDCLENSVRTNNGFRINFLNFVDDIPQRFILWSGITERLLGVPGFPWSDVSTNKINSLNPGSLSLPDLSSGLDISSYITVNGGNKESLYTPLSDGWISVALTRSGGANMAVMLRQGNFASSGHNIQQENGTTTCNAVLPVVGGVQVSINSALADGIYFAYFYPNKGNV